MISHGKNVINPDDEISSEIRAAISPMIDPFTSSEISRTKLVNGARSDTCQLTSASNDPWIRRHDQPKSNNSVSNQDIHQKNMIEYETHPYYRSLSSTSDDYPTHQDHHHQAQEQKSLSNTMVDKDIEYVESRLRGQTTVSLPANHSTSFKNDISWSRVSTNSRFAHNSPSTSNHSQTQQKTQIHQKYAMPGNRTVNNSKIPTKTATNENVKTGKRRIDKVKDQKAAKTLRFHTYF